jgi:hypothetical protein
MHRVREQRTRLLALAREEGIGIPVRLDSISSARAFAEALALCPTEDAARQALRADPEGTQAFLLVANCVQEIDEPTPELAACGPDETPFAELVFALWRFLPE